MSCSFTILNQVKKLFLFQSMNGTKGVGPFDAAYVVSMDSVFIFPSQDESVYLIDSTYNKFRKINYTSVDGYTNALTALFFLISA